MLKILNSDFEDFESSSASNYLFLLIQGIEAQADEKERRPEETKQKSSH